MANDTTIKVTDNTKFWKAEFKKAKRRGLKAIGLTAEKHAKKAEIKVDTGLLRNSITHALSGEGAAIAEYHADKGDARGSYSGTAPDEGDEAVYVGTNVDYAPYIELGAKNSQGIFFLRKAATEHTPEYGKIMKGSLENA